VKNYFRIILLLLVSFFCCSSFAAKGRKHIRWSPQAVAWAITTVEFESNRNILDSLAGAEGGDQTLEALKSFAEPGNALYQWVKEKLSRQSYKFNWDFFSWLIDICESLIELGNLSSPTQIMTAIINGKEWELDFLLNEEFRQIINASAGEARGANFIEFTECLVGLMPGYRKLEAKMQELAHWGIIPNPAFWGKAIDTAQNTHEEIDWREIQENFLSAKELDIESFLVDRSWETIGFKNSIVKYFASVMHRR
jgi:hypothetical protein